MASSPVYLIPTIHPPNPNHPTTLHLPLKSLINPTLNPTTQLPLPKQQRANIILDPTSDLRGSPFPSHSSHPHTYHIRSNLIRTTKPNPRTPNTPSPSPFTQYQSSYTMFLGVRQYILRRCSTIFDNVRAKRAACLIPPPQFRCRCRCRSNPDPNKTKIK